MNLLAQALLEEGDITIPPSKLLEAYQSNAMFMVFERELVDGSARFNLVKVSDTKHGALTQVVMLSKWQRRSYERKELGDQGTILKGTDGRIFAIIDVSKWWTEGVDVFRRQAQELSSL